MERLTEAEEVCTKINAQLKGADKKATDSLSKLTKNIQDEIKKIREKISGPTEEKQGLSRNPFLVTVLTQLRGAQQAISAKSALPGAAEEQLIANAETAVNAIVKEINEFFAGSWTSYRNYAEANRPPLFKDYKPIE
jgi:CHASE3 domain sensor protein